MNEKSSHLVKNTIGKIELSKEVNKEKCKDLSKETRYKNTNQIFNATKAEDNNIKKNNEVYGKKHNYIFTYNLHSYFM